MTIVSYFYLNHLLLWPLREFQHDFFQTYFLKKSVKEIPINAEHVSVACKLQLNLISITKLNKSTCAYMTRRKSFYCILTH